MFTLWDTWWLQIPGKYSNLSFVPKIGIRKSKLHKQKFKNKNKKVEVAKSKNRW